jgi:SAM-dependent methyltransferase
VDALTRALVESALAVFEPPDPVLEVGSLQVQGEAVGDLRPLFRNRAFIGCDMMTGPGVDVAGRVEALPLPDGGAGTVLCANVFEHAWEVRRGAEELCRVTAPKGLALVTAPFEFHIHAYPDDYWRFTPRALARLMGGFATVLVGWQGHPKTPRLVFALGLKEPPDDPAGAADAWRYETLLRWDEQPPLGKRIRSAIGGTLFGRRGWRHIRHWRDLVVEVAETGA